MSAHANINADRNTDYDAFEDAYVSGEIKNPDASIIPASLEKCDEDYIRPNADLKSRPPLISREQLKCM